MHTARLTLITRPRWLQAQRDHYAGDRRQLLAAASDVTGNEYRRPLDALPDLIRLLGYRVGRRLLPTGVVGATDVRSRTIYLCARLADKLDYPGACSAVEAFTLAHELGHLRLHLPEVLAGRLTAQHEAEADLYAACFLVPKGMTEAHPAFPALSGGELERKRAVAAMANFFGVSTSCMARCLTDLGHQVRAKTA